MLQVELAEEADKLRRVSINYLSALMQNNFLAIDRRESKHRLVVLLHFQSLDRTAEHQMLWRRNDMVAANSSE